jgi:hypothetical protein
MWSVAGRVTVIFLFWGVVLWLAISGGLRAPVSELLAVCGAGLTLMGRGFVTLRQQRRAHETTDGVVRLARQHERASV